jgi:hypothetical protein
MIKVNFSQFKIHRGRPIGPGPISPKVFCQKILAIFGFFDVFATFGDIGDENIFFVQK